MTSNAARAALAVALVVVAVVLFVVLKDDGGDDSSNAAGNGTATPTTGGEGGADGGKPDKPKPPPVQTIVVKDGAPVGGIAAIDATSGEQVKFSVRSDEPGEVHVHGYEIERPVQAGEAVTLSFPAELEGGYEIELHSHARGDIPIADLAVSPG